MSYPIILALNLTKNPQNRHFCALLGSGTLVFGHFEHKIEVFVRFYPPSPPFGRFEHIICIFVLGVAPAALSQMTLVQFYRWGDAAAEALNRWDDSLWDRCQWAAGRRPLGEGRWGDAAAEALNRWDDSRWAKAAADVGALGKFGHKKEDDRAVTLSEISERYCNPFYSSYSSLLRRSC